MGKKKLAVIGAGYLQLPLVKKAKDMGVEAVCFAWAEGAVCKDVCDRFYPVSTTDKEEILRICREIGIDGIATIASDVAAPTVAFVAEKMGLPGNSYRSAVKANNKYLMRNSFMEAGIPCPRYRMVTSPDDVLSASWVYPLIVKPSDRSGSLGVTKVLSAEELAPAVEKALSVSFKKEAMVEEFIEGREISVEFISYQGRHYPLQITDKVTTEAPHFVELEHHQPSTLPADIQDRVWELVPRALDALQIENGASHSEIKITPDGRLAVIEIGARMGGDFIGSNLVELSTGYDYLRGVIEVALGRFTEPRITKRAFSGVYFLSAETARLRPLIEKGAQPSEGILQAAVTDPVLRPVLCSADRSGYLIYANPEGRLLL